MNDNYTGYETRKTALKAGGFTERYGGCGCSDYHTESFNKDGYLNIATCERCRAFWGFDSSD